MYLSKYLSPIGDIFILSDDSALIGLCFSYPKYDEVKIKENKIINNVKHWLDEYFKGANPDPNKIDTHLQGTKFQILVWNELKKIPYGHTNTYGGIARNVAKNMGKSHMSAQAVGNAISRNPISIIVPCHRVLGSKGDLIGYAGGMEKKEWLLKHEMETKIDL